MLDYIRTLFFSSRRRHTRFDCDWSSDVCSSDLEELRRCGTRPTATSSTTSTTSSARRYAGRARDGHDVVPHAGREHHVGAVRGPGDLNRKAVVWGKGVDVGGRRVIKKEIRHLDC